MEWLWAPLGWFPSELVLPVVILKGTIGLLNVIVLGVHVDRNWDVIRPGGQRARYAALMSASLVLAEASLEQSLRPDFEMRWSNLGGLFVALILLYAARISIKEGPFVERLPRNNPKETQDE